MKDNRTLLKDFAENRSEAAIRELVERHINLVYSAAIRLVDGRTQLAEDVTQTVFLHLVRNAGKLARDPMLAGWLHRDACFVASKAMRAERRRLAREREAVFMQSLQDQSDSHLEQVKPALDHAVNQLSGDDRAAILLRFFEQRDFRAIGLALGTSEDAARMRVTRALDKLRIKLKRQRVTVSAAVLSALLAGHAVSAAPTALAASIATAAIAETAASSGVLALAKALIMAKSKLVLAGAVATVMVLSPLMFQGGALAEVRERNSDLHEQLAPLPAVQAENQRLKKLLSEAPKPASSDQQQLELMRLRNQAGLAAAQLDALKVELAAAREINAGREKLAKSYFPKTKWASLDVSTPEGADLADSWRIGMHNNSVAELLGNLSEVGQRVVRRNLLARTPSEIEEWLAQQRTDFERIDGALVVDKEVISDDEVVITSLVFQDHATNTSWTIGRRKRFGNEWRGAFLTPKDENDYK